MDASLKIPVIDSIREIGGSRRAWFVDIWGVMHNGRDAFPDASLATRAFRDTGGVVVLLSNSPRPSPALQAQLRFVGVPDEAYDDRTPAEDFITIEPALGIDGPCYLEQAEFPRPKEPAALPI